MLIYSLHKGLIFNLFVCYIKKSKFTDFLLQVFLLSLTEVILKIFSNCIIHVHIYALFATTDGHERKNEEMARQQKEKSHLFQYRGATAARSLPQPRFNEISVYGFIRSRE